MTVRSASSFQSVPSPPSAAALPLQRVTLANGVKVIVGTNPAADIIAARCFLRAGNRYEPIDQAGLSYLLAAVLTKGTQARTSFEIAEQVESVGASLGADNDADFFLLRLKTVSADFADILHLAGELLRTPAFPEHEVELERRLALRSLRSLREQPFAVAFEQLRHALYGHHPYAFEGMGTEATMAQLTREHLHAFHQTYFRPDNLVVSLWGQIKPDAAIALVDSVFGDWALPNTPLPPLDLPPLVAHPRTVTTTQDTQQAAILVGHLAPPVQSPDYIPLKLINTYLGNGLSSRLFVELREKRGLAYSVSSLYPTRLDPSHFVAYMGTAPSNTEQAIAGLRGELERLRTVPLKPDELQGVKNKMLGQYALGKQSNAQLAQIYGWYEILGLGVAFDRQFQEAVQAVTIADVQRVACRVFGEPYLSIVGPEATVADL
ncbi:M16 family metallopeptidase [Trichothermofontia sp.]